MATSNLNLETFKEKVFDFTKGEDWNFEGDNPAIIDFYADWCGSCKMVAPILEDLPEEYQGKVDIYKIDTEVEQELTAIFRIRSIPSILFIPKDGKPMMQAGAMSALDFKEVFEKELLK